MATEGLEVRSVGNTLTLYETALIEAFNLKAAIEYQMKNGEYSVTPKSNVFSMREDHNFFANLTVLARLYEIPDIRFSSFYS